MLTQNSGSYFTHEHFPNIKTFTYTLIIRFRGVNIFHKTIGLEFYYIAPYGDMILYLISL